MVNLPKVNINQNGAHKAPPDLGGVLSVNSSDAKLADSSSAQTNGKRVSQVLAQRTVFPEQMPEPSMRTLLYRLNRYHIAGAPIFRWLILLLFALGIIWFVAQAPGGWLGAVPWIIAALYMLYIRRQWRSYGYVHFETIPPPTLAPARLSAQDKYPIHVTGHFSVEGKEQDDTWLPGFYRTFATREHALLCQVIDRPLWKFARRPADEIGMWYIFFTPDMIEGVRWGKLSFGAVPQVAVAVDYKIVLPAQGRFRSAKTKIETLFIATQNEDDARAIMADLLYDLSD